MRATTPVRNRPMRRERLVALRSSMPVQLVTLRHDVPAWDAGDDEDSTTRTPKVDPARRAVETAARKGGSAR